MPDLAVVHQVVDLSLVFVLHVLSEKMVIESLYEGPAPVVAEVAVYDDLLAVFVGLVQFGHRIIDGSSPIGPGGLLFRQGAIEPLVNYDRGWDTRPKSKAAKAIYKEILAMYN